MPIFLDHYQKFFNQSLLQGVVPDILKISEVTPVDKGGDTTDPANYRLISTLSTFTQIFEKLVYKQLIGYIKSHNGLMGPIIALGYI